MAELYDTSNPEIFPSIYQNGASQRYTGNQKIDEYIDKLPKEEREEAIKQITAPTTGAEIHQDMLADPNYDPKYEDWIKLNEFYDTRESELFANLGDSARHVFTTIGKGLSVPFTDPSEAPKVPASVLEGAAQNAHMLYGILAQSADSTSPQNRFFNAIMGRKQNSQESYKNFLEARQFHREGDKLMKGELTMLLDKDYVNNDVVQAAAFVADPMFILPFGKAFTAGAGLLNITERMAVAQAKAQAIRQAVIGGTVKYGVGAPIEFLGRATRNTIDMAIEKSAAVFEGTIGMSANEAQTTLRMSGMGAVGAGIAGHAIPYATPIATANLYGTAAAGLGETIGLIGDQMMKRKRGLMSYAEMALIETKQAGIPISAHAERLLKILKGVDPMVDYGTTLIGGSVHGSFIGAGLGWWSEGKAGVGGGMGAGIALGAMGAGSGRVIADLTGATRLARTGIQADFVLQGLKDFDPAGYQQWNNLRTFGKAIGYNFDGLIAAKDKIIPDAKIFFRNDFDHAEYLRSRGLDPVRYDGTTFLPNGEKPLTMDEFNHANGFVIENKATGGTEIHINTELSMRNKSNSTVGHELFHGIMRTSAMKDFFVQDLKEKVLGVRNSNGEMINNPVVDPREVGQMFRRYIDAEYKNRPNERADAIKRLELAEDKFRENGEFINDEQLGRPYLEHLTEEFGAYYFSHFIANKPIDYLFFGGDLPGIRGVLDSVGMNWTSFWQSRIQATVPALQFEREYFDPVTQRMELVPIDEVFKPWKQKRVVNSALDFFMRDMIRAVAKSNMTGDFDISRLSPESQKRFVDGNGLDGTFVKQTNGTYRLAKPSDIKAENRIKGREVHKILMSIPEAERTFTVDEDGTVRGPFSDQILDMIVNSGHMSREHANKLKMFQSIVEGKNRGNLVDFSGIGATEEVMGDVNNPSRRYGKNVAFKHRTGVVFGLDIKISPKGDYSFNAHMLDYKVIENRAINQWSDPVVQKLWNGNYSEFLADFYRYLENASKDPTDDSRVKSKDLWIDGKGDERRNVMHQVLGLANTDPDTFINSPSAVINRNAMSTVFSFNTNRMANVRMRDFKVPYVHQNAYMDLRNNWQPSEMRSERTASGDTIFSHISGFKFISKPSGKTEAFDDNGKKIGVYDTKQQAAEAGRKYAEKNPPAVLQSPTFQPVEAIGEFGREYDMSSREWRHGFIGKVHEIHGKTMDPDGNLQLEFKGKIPRTVYEAPEFSLEIGDRTVMNGHRFGKITGTVEIFNGELVANIGGSNIYSDTFKGKGYGKLIYSELTERLRAMGVKKLEGVVVDSRQRPLFIREKMFKELMQGVYDETGQKVWVQMQKQQGLGWKKREYRHLQKGALDPLAFAVQVVIDPRAHYMPFEAGGEAGADGMGGRRYSPEQLKTEFIGRFASENPQVTKDLRISFEEYDRGGEKEGLLRLFKKKFNGKEEEIGHFDARTLGFFNSDPKKFPRYSISGESFIMEPYRGKGYGKLMYSELAERLRNQGSTKFIGQIENAHGEPQAIREQIIGRANRLASGDQTQVGWEGSPRKGVGSSELRQDAWYQPTEAGGEGAKADIRSKESKQKLREWLSSVRDKDDFDFKKDTPDEIKSLLGSLENLLVTDTKEKQNYILNKILSSYTENTSSEALKLKELNEKLKLNQIKKSELIDFARKNFPYEWSRYGTDFTHDNKSLHDSLLTRLGGRRQYKEKFSTDSYIDRTGSINQQPPEAMGEAGAEVYRDRRVATRPFSPMYEGMVPFGEVERDVFEPLTKTETPDPTIHSVWQFLDWHKRFGKKREVTKTNDDGTETKSKESILPLKETLEFMALRQGPASDQLSYTSQWARTILTLLQGTKVLNHDIQLTKGGRGGGGEKTIRIPTEFQDVKKDKAGEIIAQSLHRVNEPLNLTFAELIEQFQRTEGTITGSPKKNMRLIGLKGRGFEGLVLEEVMHYVHTNASKSAIKEIPELQPLLDGDGTASGTRYRFLVDELLKKAESEISSGKKTYEPETVAWLKIVKIHRHATQNIFAVNKSGTKRSLWELLEFNSKNPDKGAELGKAWEVPQIRKMIGGKLFDENGHTTSQHMYRYQNLWEFLVQVHSDPLNAKMLAELPEVDLSKLDPATAKNAPKNSLNLLGQMLDAVADFFGLGRGENKSLLRQLGAESLNLVESFRRKLPKEKADVGFYTKTESGEMVKVSKFSFGNYEKILRISKLLDVKPLINEVDRPVGTLSKTEVSYVGLVREAMANLAKDAGIADEFKGLNDWEVWQLMGSQENRAKFGNLNLLSETDKQGRRIARFSKHDFIVNDLIESRRRPTDYNFPPEPSKTTYPKTEKAQLESIRLKNKDYHHLTLQQIWNRQQTGPYTLSEGKESKSIIQVPIPPVKIPEITGENGKIKIKIDNGNGTFRVEELFTGQKEGEIVDRNSKEFRQEMEKTMKRLQKEHDAYYGKDGIGKSGMLRIGYEGPEGSLRRRVFKNPETGEWETKPEWQEFRQGTDPYFWPEGDEFGGPPPKSAEPAQAKPPIIDPDTGQTIDPDTGQPIDPTQVPTPDTGTPMPPVDPTQPVPTTAVPPPPTPTPTTTPTPTPRPTPVVPQPVKRNYTQADVRVWRSYKTETTGNGEMHTNGLGYYILSLGKNYRVYNPQKALLGIYKELEDAKKRIQKEEPRF